MAVNLSFTSTLWQDWWTGYLHTLHLRSKWLKLSQLVSTVTLVVVKQDNLPPLHCPLGRIVKVQFGKDGNVRVAVSASRGTLKSPLVIPVPITIGQLVFDFYFISYFFVILHIPKCAENGVLSHYFHYCVNNFHIFVSFPQIEHKLNTTICFCLYLPSI